jgi:hypothetical protein
MSRKSFTDANPAMAFISTAKEQEDFALTQPTKEEILEKNMVMEVMVMVTVMAIMMRKQIKRIKIVR